MLNKLQTKYDKKNFGLYRDDGLGILKNMSGPQSEKVKKDIKAIFKEEGLDLIIECNKNIVDYLDITLNLKDGTYKPYQKPDNTLTYIHTESNHPPNIIKQIPKTIEKRLSDNSANEQIFSESAEIYENALKKSGYNVKLKYNPTAQKANNNKNHKRKIIWFNPPFNKNVKTKIGHHFLNLIDKHFPKEHKYHRLFNRNNVKVSYSCTKNMKSIITNNNKSILNKENQQNKKNL